MIQNGVVLGVAVVILQAVFLNLILTVMAILMWKKFMDDFNEIPFWEPTDKPRELQGNMSDYVGKDSKAEEDDDDEDLS